jgi:two-component system nitrate/nitrite response regulator NarL
MRRPLDVLDHRLAAAPSGAQSPDGALRIFVLAEVRALGEGLARLLRDEPGFEVAGSGPPDPDCAQRIAAAGARVVVLDGSSADAPALARRLGAECPGCRLLAVGMPEDEAMVLQCAQAGVAGYVSRDAPSRALVESVREVAEGGFPCPREIAAILFRQVARRQRAPVEAAPLTAREREIVGLIDRGFTNREIGRALSIEVATVKNHVHNIFEKLRVKRRAAAAAKLRGAAAG